MAERQGYAPCLPWPARIAPADRCPNLLHANSSNVLIPAYAHKHKRPRSGPFMFMAERQGFEPWNTREDVTGIPVQRLRPLGHLSRNFCSLYQIACRRRLGLESSSALLRTSCAPPLRGRLSSPARNRSSSLPANLVDRSATSPKSLFALPNRLSRATRTGLVQRVTPHVLSSAPGSIVEQCSPIVQVRSQRT
jgi:hypothetical protein